jgi:hypothetical protein
MMCRDGQALWRHLTSAPRFPRPLGTVAQAAEIRCVTLARAEINYESRLVPMAAGDEAMV